MVLAVLFSAFSSYAQNTFPTTGNVGIGTTAPSSKLQISESSDSKPSGVVAATKSVFKLSRFGTPNYSYNESAEFRIGHGGPGVWGSKLDLFVNGANNQNDIPDQQVMTWLYNGRVGVGTSSPNVALDINGSLCGGNTNLDGFNTNFLANSSKVLIGWNRTAGAGETDLIANQGLGSVGGFAFYNHDNSNNEKQLMWLTGDGRLMIGLTTGNTGNNKLAVGGGVIAESVTVKLQANWPDYVFEKNYQLPSLTDVKTYVDQNHHLPEIPSEQEVAKNGVNLGEMNKLLLKKVEELTLYLIEKDKEVKAQSQNNYTLQAKQKIQQEQIDRLNKKIELLADKIK